MMGDQQSLFATIADDAQEADEARKLARSTDPESSHLGAREHVRSGNNASQKAQVLELVRACTRPVTVKELVRAGQAKGHAWMEAHAVTKRLNDLNRAGDVAQDSQRQCGVSGRLVVTWRVRQ